MFENRTTFLLHQAPKITGANGENRLWQMEKRFAKAREGRR